MLRCSFSFAAAQLLVQMTSALQERQCCSAVPAAQHSENCSATSVFACGMLQGWGLEGWGLGLAEFDLRDPQGPLNRGASNGGVSRSGLFCPFLSFFVLFGTFPIFPGFSRFVRGHRSSKNAVRRFFLYYDQVKICLIKSSDSPITRRKKRLINWKII